MGNDIAPRTPTTVAVEPVQPAQQRAADASQAAVHGIEHIQVGDEQARHRRQVAAAPIAVDISLASADGTVARNHAPDRVVEDLDLGHQGAGQVTEAQWFAIE